MPQELGDAVSISNPVTTCILQLNTAQRIVNFSNNKYKVHFQTTQEYKISKNMGQAREADSLVDSSNPEKIPNMINFRVNIRTNACGVCAQ